MSNFDVNFDHHLYPGDLIALEFITAVQEEDGVLTYGDALAQGDFQAATDATSTVMVTQAKAFWATGVINAGGSTKITGFSPSTAYEYFDCFISDLTGTGTWQYASASVITGANFAKAIRGLNAQGDFAAASDVWDWLHGAVSNPTFEPTAADTSQTLTLATRGTYDPHLALAVILAASSATNMTGLYDWSTLGLLAPVKSARDRGKFIEGRNEVSKYHSRWYGPRDQEQDRLSLRGRSGMGFQTNFTDIIELTARRVYDAQTAAIIGHNYREVPKIYSVRDHVVGGVLGVSSSSSAGGGSSASSSSSSSEESSPAANSIGLLVPTYFDPPDPDWNTILAITSVPVIAIVNPNSGPGSSVDGDYTTLIGQLAFAGQTAIGYVSTSYGARAEADVLADVLKWKTFYPSIAGIFFDEQPTNAINVAQYKIYFDYARSVISGATVVSNPGTSCDQGYLSTAGADILVMSESGATIGNLPAWAQGAADTHFAGLGYGANQASMEASVAALPGQGYGWCYITSESLAGDPWDQLTSYMAAEVAALEAAG